MGARESAGLFFVVTSLLLPATAGATVIDVETDGDEFGTNNATCALREAVEAARTNDPFGGCAAGDANDTIQLVGDAVLTIDGNTATNADGDLDYDGGGKLTILGEAGIDPNPPDITQDFSDRILEITHQKGVRLQGVELEGGGNVNSGGAVRAAQGSSLTLDHSLVHDNIASLRGGGIACEGCKSLKLTSAFHVEDNLVNGSSQVEEGGGIWSNAPTRLKGTSGGPIQFLNARVIDNTVNPAGTNNFSRGGGVWASDDLTITKTYFNGNEALDRGAGGGVLLDPEPDDLPVLKLFDSTLQANTAQGSGGGLATLGDSGVQVEESAVDIRRSAIVDNDTTGSTNGGGAFAGGLFIDDAGGKIVDSAIDGNTATATSVGDVTAGGGIFQSVEDAGGAYTLRLDRTSVTNNNLAVGESSSRGGGLVIQGRLVTLNTTIAGNSAPGSSADGGGLTVETSGAGEAQARLDFTTIKANAAGGNGDGLDTEGPVTMRASVIDQSADACSLDSVSGEVTSKGFNVDSSADPDCALTKPTDSNNNDALLAVGPNGSPPVGTNPEIRQTSAFTSIFTPLLNRVPLKKCKVGKKAVTVDARGAPRPAGAGCDTGAVELVTCLGTPLVGEVAQVGTNRGEEIQGTFPEADVVLAQGGDDDIRTYGSADSICAGSGDDEINPGENAMAGDDSIDGQAGVDLLNYNGAAPLSIDMANHTATGPGVGTDDFKGIENVQASEGDDELLGDNRDNLLIGGGNSDLIKGRGGIDVIDAKDGEPDIEIDCGPGLNALEKAKYDVGLDPQPQSC